MALALAWGACSTDANRCAPRDQLCRYGQMLALVAGPVLTMTLHGAVLNGMHPTRAVALEVARCAVTALGLLWFLQVCARMPASPPPPLLGKMPAPNAQLSTAGALPPGPLAGAWMRHAALVALVAHAGSAAYALAVPREDGLLAVRTTGASSGRALE